MEAQPGPICKHNLRETQKFASTYEKFKLDQIDVCRRKGKETVLKICGCCIQFADLCTTLHFGSLKTENTPLCHNYKDLNMYILQNALKR